MLAVEDMKFMKEELFKVKEDNLKKNRENLVHETQ
jgi:hypothetical protein